MTLLQRAFARSRPGVPELATRKPMAAVVWLTITPWR